jgi:hypothetical protein
VAQLTLILKSVLVIECDEEEESLFPKPLHRLDYQTGVLRLEFENTEATKIMLLLCGVKL